MKKTNGRTIRVSVYLERKLFRRMQKIRDRVPMLTLSTQFQMAATTQTPVLERGLASRAVNE